MLELTEVKVSMVFLLNITHISHIEKTFKDTLVLGLNRTTAVVQHKNQLGMLWHQSICGTYYNTPSIEELV